jgi:hypothetical protein
VAKEFGGKEGSERDVEFNESEDDLFSSQELEVLVKDMGWMSQTPRMRWLWKNKK